MQKRAHLVVQHQQHGVIGRDAVVLDLLAGDGRRLLRRGSSSDTEQQHNGEELERHLIVFVDERTRFWEHEQVSTAFYAAGSDSTAVRNPVNFRPQEITGKKRSALHKQPRQPHRASPAVNSIHSATLATCHVPRPTHTERHRDY